jgi:MinD-like ATPase involved in chromosome partitioning or flagellar assembly
VFVTVWSVKGGAGVSVVSAALAAVLGRRRGGSLLVDLAGDQPAVVGLPEPSGPGVRDWLALPDGSPASLDRLVVEVSPSVRLLPSGSPGPVPDGRADALVDALRARTGAVVVDGGNVHGSGDGAALTSALAAAGVSLFVTRPCYLSLRRAVRSGVQADGVVLVADAGRSLDRRDVADVLGVPVLAVVQVDPVVARTVDAGLLVSRLPRVLERSLRAVA